MKDTKLHGQSKSRELHGQSKTAEYRAWCAIINKCENEAGHDWKYYGGRGIKMNSQWRASFEAFLGDVGPRPTAKNRRPRAIETFWRTPV